MLFRLPPIINLSLVGFIYTLTLSACGVHKSERFGGLHSPTDNSDPRLEKPVETALIAIQTRDLKSLESLATEKFDFRQVLIEGRPALHEASRVGAVKVVRWLLQQGIEAKSVDDSGRLAEEYAENQPVILKIFNAEIEAQDRVALMLSVMSGHTQDVKRLLAQNTATQFHDTGSGHTPLTAAIQNNRELVVRALLQHKPSIQDDLENAVDVNFKTQTDLSPLALARQLNLKRIEQLLLREGAKED
ncbi:MAG: ankyrin repeat domain-containing protein [Bdellovibrionales bacterium]